ncbi:MAG: hypothetical protein ACE5EF_07310, partial [Dehalococcoidia bacterium]
MVYVPLDHPLIDRLREHVLFAAGPIGSTILALDLGPEAFVAFPGTVREEAHEGCPEWLNLSRPDILEGIFESF